MHRQRPYVAVIPAIVASLALFTAVSAAQSQRPAQPAMASAPQMSEKDLAAMQDELLKELRVSPTLAEVVARDPSLLSNADYVSRNNPELDRFLQAHPEIAKNPDFYLFNNLHGQNEPPAQTLERKLWPEMSSHQDSTVARDLVEGGLPLLAFICMAS